MAFLVLVRGEPIKPYYGADLRIFHRSFDKSCINYTKTAKSVLPISAGIEELRVLSLIRPQLYWSARQILDLLLLPLLRGRFHQLNISYLPINNHNCGYYCSPLHCYVDASVGLLVSSRFLPYYD